MRRIVVSCDWCGKEKEMPDRGYMDSPYGWLRLVISMDERPREGHGIRGPLNAGGWSLEDLPHGVTVCGRACAEAYLLEAEKYVAANPEWAQPQAEIEGRGVEATQAMAQPPLHPPR